MTEEVAVPLDFVRTLELASDALETQFAHFESGASAGAVVATRQLTGQQRAVRVEEHRAEVRLDARLHGVAELGRRVGVTRHRCARQTPRFDVKDVQPAIGGLETLPRLVDLDEGHLLSGLSELGLVATVEDLKVHRQRVEEGDALLFDQRGGKLRQLVVLRLVSVRTVHGRTDVLVVTVVVLRAVLLEVAFENAQFVVRTSGELRDDLLDHVEVHA